MTSPRPAEIQKMAGEAPARPEHHVGIVARERTELRSKHRSRGKRRDDQAHASRRRIALPGDLSERGANTRERRSQRP
jgi:hypothetical protein